KGQLMLPNGWGHTTIKSLVYTKSLNTIIILAGGKGAEWCTILLTSKKWDQLSTAYRSIVRAASALANEWVMAKYDANNPAALRRLVADGAELRPFNQSVLEASYKAANEVYADTSAKNADFKKIYDDMVSFRGSEYQWWQVAEYAFDTFQIRMRTRG